MSQTESNQNIDYRRTMNVARVHNSAAREKADLGTDNGPLSLGAFAAAIIVALFGGGYFFSNTASSFNRMGANYQPVPPAYSGPSDDGKPVDPIKAGEKIYKNACANCHQQDGNGAPGQYPSLVASEYVTEGDERLGALIYLGLAGEIKLKGGTFSSPQQMPSHRGIMTPANLANVMSYIRNTWGNKADVVSEIGVAALITKYKAAPSPANQAFLDGIDPKAMLPKPAAAPVPAAAPGAAAPAPAAAK